MDGSGHRLHRVPLGIVCLVLLVIGNVQTEATCRTGCKGGSPQTFKFAIGSTYKYSYEGKINISLSSAEGQATGTDIKADVLLTQLPDCNQLLSLQNVQILSNGSKHGQIPDIEKPIRINNHDGVLEDSICVVEGDNQNSINVKRAIASMFQASMKTGYETDVFGRCPTEFSSHKEGSILVIQKTRSLNRCSYREHIKQDFLSTALNLNSEIKSSPFLSGDYNANLRVKNGILEQATIVEDYLYVPFSVGQNGAKAQVVGKLHLSGISKDSAQALVTKPRSIIFENPHPVVAPTSNVQTILGAVKEVANTVDVVVGEETAKEFINLLKIVQVSDKNDLLVVYNQIKSGAGLKNKDAAKRLYIDALLRAGNGDTIEALLELLNNSQLDSVDSGFALLGLNVVRHATEGSLKAAGHLLEKPKLPREAYLGIGNLVGRFCQQHDCDNVAEVKTLTNKLLEKIHPKPNNRDEENDTIFALKALANFRHFNDNVIPKIISLAQNKNLPNRMRVAALEAYLADPCKDKLRNSALPILQDIQQDSEVRIKAYLALAQCPNAKIGNAIKTLLTKEPSIQVGGFISSHMHSLRASANPDKALAKQFLGFSVKRNFPIDPRKYSFNGEFSYAIDTLGIGEAYELNVIYSQNSWLPRSTSLNLTAEIFGHSFNFLEIETRQENLDKLVEHYFGPQGILRRSAFSSIVKEGATSYHKLADYVNKKLTETLSRGKRDVSKAEIDHISKQVQIKTHELNKDLDMDVSLKAFGSEIFFLNINQEAKVTPEAIIDKIIAQLSKGLDKLQRFEETLRHNLHFMDSEFDYPTSLGFPLRLALEGAANIQVKAEGNIDVRKLLNNPEKGDLRVKLLPSANIEVSGRLTLDALVVENGLKVVSTLYTATGGDLKASWDKKTGFDVKLGLPEQDQKLVSVNHEILFVTREQASREVGLPLTFTQQKDFEVCLDQANPLIGVTFCIEMNGPDVGGQHIPILPFPFAGDAKFSLWIINEDVSEYRIKHSIKEAHTGLIFETIDKNKQKKASLDLEAEIHPDKYIKAVLNSAIKSVNAEARIVSTNVEKYLLLKLQHDALLYSGKIGVSVSGTPERAVYKPLLEFKAPNARNNNVPETQNIGVKVDGQVIVERSGENIKLTFDNVKVERPDAMVAVTGHIGRTDGVFVTDLTVSEGKNNVAVEGRLQLTPELIKFNIKAQNSFNNNANFHLKGELKRQPEHHEFGVQLIHGPDLNSKTAILTIHSTLVNKFKSATDFRFETKNSIKYPLAGISGKFEMEQTPKSLDYEVNAEYGDLKLGSELEAKIDEKTPGDYQIEFDLWGLNNKLELKSKRTVLPNDESKISNTVEMNGKKFEVEGTIKHRVRPQNIDVGTELTVHIPSQAGPISVSTGLKLNQDELDAHTKITSGSDHIIDAFVKGNKKGNVNGSLKINVKNSADINGKIHANNGAGNGEILIDLQNGKRQIKADTTFNVKLDKEYDVTLNIYPSFNKDKNAKIHLSTQNKVSVHSIDSQNKVDVFGHPLEVNFKGSRTGDYDNGKADGEFEVTLPGEQYISFKGNADYKKENEIESGNAQTSMEYRKNKNTPGRKYTSKGTWKNTNIEEGLIDMDLTLTADDSNGRSLNVDSGIKASKDGETRHLTFNYKVHGSVLKVPYELKVISNCKKGLINQYEIHSTYGPANTFTLKGNHDFSGLKKGGGLRIQASTESPHLKTLDVDLRGSVVRPEDAKVPFELEGTANVQANNAQGSIIDLKSSGDIKLSTYTGEVKGNVALNQIDPISIAAKYDHTENKLGGSTSGTVTYGKGQTIKYDVSLEKSADHHQYKLVASLQTPVEGHKNTKLIVSTKRSKDGSDVTSQVELTADGKTWKSDSQLVLNELSPVVNVKLTCPEGKLTQFFVKGNKVSNRQFGGEIKLVKESNSFLFEGSLQTNLENVENLMVKGQLNSPTLNLNKITFEAHNKGSANDKKMQVIIKTAGKNYISGNVGYTAKEENGKFIITGSGDFKVKDESKSGNFKYILENLKMEKNKEEGVQITFDAALGNKNIDAEYKLTNKHFRWQNSYCEQKKECANIEIDNKINRNDADNFNEVLEISLDLRKLGLSHEFGLKAVTNRKGWEIDHTVDAHFQNQESSKYQYSFYIHPTNAGVSLTTPKRIVALEAKTTMPKDFKQGGKSSGEVAFYMDKKNNPNKKTALTWSLDLDIKGKLNGESKFTHPGLRRPLVGSFKATRTGNPINGQITLDGVLDVFAQENQKLVVAFVKTVNVNDAKTKGDYKITVGIKSTGLGLDIQSSETIFGDSSKKEFNYEYINSYQLGKTKYENIMSSKWSPHEISGVIKVLNKVLFKGTHKIQVNGQEQIIDSELSSYDNNPILSRVELKNYNTLAYSLGYKNDPGNKLLFNAGLIPGQLADVRADHLVGGKKVNLFFATIKLDDANFLKPESKVNSKAIENLIHTIKGRSSTYLNGLGQISKEWAEEAKKEAHDISELSKKASPNLQPLKNYYSKELQEVKEEILSDKSIKELGEAIRKVMGTLITTTTELLEKLSELAEKSALILENSFKSVIESLEKELIPQIKEISARLLDQTKEILDISLNMVLGVLAKASQILEKYQPELQELATTFGELFQDMGRLVFRVYEQAQENVKGFVHRISNEWESSPYLKDLSGQFEYIIKEIIPNPESIINVVREVFFTIRDAIPEQFIVKGETEQLLDTVLNYLEKKLNRKPVDDIKELEHIGAIFVQIYKKLFGLITSEKLNIPENKLNSNLPTFSYLKNLPRLVAIKFSPIAYLLDQDSSEQIAKFLLSLVDSPRNLIPPYPLFGLIIQGQHIFTFDGKHLTFPGKCNYLFARDAWNGNFTLAGSFKDGLLNSITLADQHGSVTLINGGKVKAQQDAVELPYRKPTIAAWRGYETITLYSTAGITVTCTPDLSGCSVKVSGFYHGQVRGLLGNGNSEPYDDFTIPNGKIVNTEGQFGNAYKLTSSCADVTVPKHESIAANPVCSKLFNWESSLSLCYPFVSTENFKAACAHGLAANVKGTEEAIAKAYVAACQDRNIPVHVPEDLVKCTNSEKPFSVGETFSVKLPSKAADIVIVVESDKANQQLYDKLVKNLVPEISTELHNKGVRDIEFHLITYGGQNQWPSHNTVNGKLTFKGKAPALKFGEAPEEHFNIKEIKNPQMQQVAEELKNILHDLTLGTKMNLKTRTFEAAAEHYPFRANALKSIVVVNGQQCEVGKFYPLQKLVSLFYKDELLSVNLFTPFSNLNAKDSKKAKDIVGFNTQNVFTLSQAKKNPKGSSELHKELNYEDYCVDFTLNNRGNAFVNDNFLALGEADQKTFVKVAATNIADQLLNIEQGLDCECKMVNPWHASNVCTEAYSKDRPSKKV